MSKKTECDVVVIGSGPAGCSAAIYAARAALKVCMIAGHQAGGQLTITTDVENYPGFAEPIQGPYLMEEMQKQAVNVGCTLVTDHVIKLSEPFKSPFTLECESGASYSAGAVIIATGAQARWLGLDSEKKFRGYGVSGCATCDAFFFKNQEVAVVGGGNTAVEEALYLTKHASKVYLIHRRDALRAEKILQKRLFSSEKIKPIWNSTLDEVIGTETPLSVSGIKIKSVITGEVSTLDVQGVFIAIGHSPNSKLLEGIVKLNESGYVVVPGKDTATTVPGIFACGDVQDMIYRQAVTAAGTGCMAALDAVKFLEARDT